MKHGVSGLAQESRGRPAAALDRHRARVPAADVRHGQAGDLRRDRLPAPRPVARARAVHRAAVRHRDDALLQRACRRRRRISRNALFSGLFPGEIAARFPDWWGEREDETLNAHERQLLEAQLARAESQAAGALREDLDRRRGRRPRATPVARRSRPKASRRSSSTSSICSRTAGPSRRSCTRWRATRSRFASSRSSGSGDRRCSPCCRKRRARKVKVLVTSDHGSIHCRTPATVFAKRDATQNLRYKFGEDLRAENPEQAMLFTKEDSLQAAAPRAGREHAARDRRFVLRVSRPSCASIRAGIAARSCTAA